ncbi:MAG: hypothetical protein KAV82_03360 [Phycisphaerae bacterium]|nr:hypothetical protein [Phycisphaerae bacterium]
MNQYLSLSLLAELERSLGNENRSGPLYRQAHEVAVRLVAAEPQHPRYLRHLAQSLVNLGCYVECADNIAGRGHWLDQAIEIHRRLAAAEPNSVDCKAGLGAILVTRAQQFHDRGDDARARMLAAEAIPLLERVTAARPRDWGTWGKLLNAHRLHAIALHAAVQTAEAARAAEAALRICSMLVAEPDSSPAALSYCASTLLTIRPEEARDTERAVEIAERVVRLVAARSPIQYRGARAYYPAGILALAHAAAENWPEATHWQQLAIEVCIDPADRALLEKNLARYRAAAEATVPSAPPDSQAP